MVSDATPDEASTLTSLPFYVNPRRISGLSDSRLLNPKKSQRRLQVRPSHPALAQQQRLDHEAAHQDDMKRSSVQPAPQTKKSSSSLFNLFSKPKVEKARGYGGEAASSPALPKPAAPLKSAIKSNPPLLPSAAPPRPPSQQIQPSPRPIPPIRAFQRVSIQQPPSQQIQPAPQPTPPVRAPQRASIQRVPDSVRSSKHEKPAQWVAPPLFQAFARSVKHGLCETSVTAASQNAARLRAAAKEKELEEVQSTQRNSLDSEVSEQTRRSKMTVQTSRGLSSTHVEVPQKIVVLLDDGHILQYSQHGPTNRLPEKVLQLGPESTAHISDATAHSPGALRIVQNAHSKTFSLQSTVNAFSRLTRRSTTPKRDVPNLLFAFRSTQEINEWLHAVRGYVDSLARPTSTSSHAASEKEQVDSVVDDSMTTSKHPDTTVPTAAPSATPSPAHATPDPKPQISTPPKPIQPATFDDDSDDSQRKGSLEMVEEEAEKLLLSPQQRLSLMGNLKRMSDAPSFRSSGATSVDAQALSNLRNSVRMSVQTNMTSRTSSLISEASSNKASVEDSASIKSPYRNLTSYQAAKRRSALPVVNTAPTSQPSTELTPDQTATKRASVPESPLLGLAMHPPSTVAAPPSSSSVMRSPSKASNAVAETGIVESTPTIAEEDERPESIVADLPPPSTWTSKLSPRKRASLTTPSPPIERQQYRYSSAPLTHTPQQAAAAASRRASHGFRIPLKINPNVPTDRPSSRTKNRNSVVPDPPAEQPKVFTLEAKVDPKTHRMSIGQQSFSSTELRNRTSQRLSLFPSPLLPQSTFPDPTRSRTSSMSAATQLSSQSVPARNASLQRPTSLQVRSTNAPFLSSIRSPTIATAPAMDSPQAASATDKVTPADAAAAIQRLASSSTAVPIRAAPIRQLKPSRSASAISTMAPVSEYARPASPTDPFTSRQSPIFDDDSGIHIPPRKQSYRASYTPGTVPPASGLPLASGVPMGNSFAQQHMMRRTSLRPRQSFIAPMTSIETLGPPAPPPNAPLPAPPDGAPPGILSLGTGPVSLPQRASVRLSTQGPSQVNGLGIRA